jgi:hypothetical protein
VRKNLGFSTSKKSTEIAKISSVIRKSLKPVGLFVCCFPLKRVFQTSENPDDRKSLIGKASKQWGINYAGKFVGKIQVYFLIGNLLHNCGIWGEVDSQYFSALGNTLRQQFYLPPGVRVTLYADRLYPYHPICL